MVQTTACCHLNCVHFECNIYCYIHIYPSSVHARVGVDPLREGRHTGVDRGLSHATHGTSAGSNVSEHPAAILVANSRASGITLKYK